MREELDRLRDDVRRLGWEMERLRNAVYESRMLLSEMGHGGNPVSDCVFCRVAEVLRMAMEEGG